MNWLQHGFSLPSIVDRLVATLLQFQWSGLLDRDWQQHTTLMDSLVARCVLRFSDYRGYLAHNETIEWEDLEDDDLVYLLLEGSRAPSRWPPSSAPHLPRH